MNGKNKGTDSFFGTCAGKLLLPWMQVDTDNHAGDRGVHTETDNCRKAAPQNGKVLFFSLLSFWGANNCPFSTHHINAPLPYDEVQSGAIV